VRRRIKNYASYILDVILLFLIVFNLTSSYILWFILPRGIGYHGSPKCSMQGYGISGTGWEVLGWNRVTWIEVHNWASIALLVIILLHIIFHWGWIVATTKRVKSYIGKRISKVTELYIAAVVLFILFLFESLSGFVIWLFLPRGAGDYFYMIIGYGRTFWGLQRNVWADLHAWGAVTILAIVIIHLILNWNWIVAVSKNISRGISGVLLKPFRKVR
jgi:hypothetical protein